MKNGGRFIQGLVALVIGTSGVLATSGAILPAQAAGGAAAGLAVSVGYADSLRPTPNLPVPWRGAPHTLFIGSAGPWDASAIRLDNTTAAPISVSDVKVNLHGHLFDLWGSFVIPSGTSAILTQTAQFNFDGSDFPITSCGVLAASNAPTISISVAGAVPATLTDSAHILDTFGYDSICRVPNESLQWRPIGVIGGISATLSLNPPASTKMLGTPDTSTATLSDAAGKPLPNVQVNFQVTSGPNAGKTGQGMTDGQGHVPFTYTSSHLGADTIVASVTNASGGSFSSNTVKVNWIHGSTLMYSGAVSQDFNDPATLAATLVDEARNPVADAPITFTLAKSGQTCTAMTNGTGWASCSITPNEAAGPDTVKASFGGDAQHAAVSTSSPFMVTLEEDTLDSTPKLVLMPQGGKVTLSATLMADGTTPLAGRAVTETLGSGSGAQHCTGTTDATGTITCSISPVSVPLGPQPLTDSFTSDGFYRAATHDQHSLVFAYLAHGSFVVGDRSDSVGSSAMWWGAQWTQHNSLSGGPAPHAFKGFADTLSSTPPTCGGTWRSDPGNSSRPPDSVPSYMAVIAAGSIGQSGSTISGNVAHIVIVKTDAGYADNPGHAGTGSVVAQLCP